VKDAGSARALLIAAPIFSIFMLFSGLELTVKSSSVAFDFVFPGQLGFHLCKTFWKLFVDCQLS
jgi:hypothetical protein